MAPPTKNDTRPKASLNGASWRFSDAREQLAQDLIDGIIPLEGPFDSADIFDSLWKDNPAFKNFPYDKVRYDGRIESMRRQVLAAQNYASTDHTALLKDRQVYPIKGTSIRGKLRWRGSKAEAFLEDDVENGRHIGKAPRTIWASRDAYKAFELVVFRKHLDQLKEKLKPYDKRPGQCRKNKHKLGDSDKSRLLQK